MAAVINFMDSPLVVWVQTFSEDNEPVDFQELCDAVYLNDVMAQIDHRDLDIDTDIKRVPKDTNAKIQNWSVLIQNIYNYYQDVLQQLVVMEIPDIVSLVKDSTKESSLACMEKMILLLLGCAVQCDQKEGYINNIKSLDLHVQQAMVTYIQEITDNCENVLALDLDDRGSDLADKQLYQVIRNIVDDRDSISQKLVQLTQERDYYQQELIEKHGRPLTPPVHLEKYHLYSELGSWKQKANKLLEEIEEKSKLISDQQDDLDAIKGQYLQVKSENMLLIKDAKAVHAYRDELDVLKEKALKLDRSEKEVHRYKEKVSELDFYKSRVEELRQDNDSLSEVRTHLTDQLSDHQKKINSVMDELVRCQIQAEEFVVEKDRLNKHLHEVMDENSILEFEKSKFSESYTGPGIRRILSTSSINLGSQCHLAGALSDELHDSVSSHVTRLEIEKDEMKQELEDAKHRLSDVQQMLQKVQMETEREIRSKIVDLEHQTKRLRTQNVKELSQEYHHKIEDIEQQSLDLKQKMSEEFKGRVSQLEREKQDLRARESEHHRKLKFIQDAWERDREKCVMLERARDELHEENTQFKCRIQMIQEGAREKVDYLERQVKVTEEGAREEVDHLEQQIKVMREDSSSIHRQNVRICNLCGHDSIRVNAEVDTRRLSDCVFGDHIQGDPEIMALTGSPGVRDHPPVELVEKCVQTSPPPAWISYNEGMHGKSGQEANNNNKPKSKSGSKSKFLDILRPKSARQGSPAPSRPATVLGVLQENVMTPPRGVVTPQRRSVPNTPDFGDCAFKRGDRLRSTIQPGGSFRDRGVQRPTSEYMPFSRGDRLRCTMPEKKTVYVTPERRQHLTPCGSRSSISSIESVKSSRHDGHGSFDYSGCSLPRDLDPRREGISERLDSDKDSGCPTSPDTPINGEPPRTPSKDPHLMTSFRVVSTDMVKTQIRTSTLPKMSEKWRAMVEKVADLQDKNQQLLADNATLRKSLNSIKFSNDRIDLLEKRNLNLEVENRKLRKIIESMQSSLSGMNTYDKRTYHFYSNV